MTAVADAQPRDAIVGAAVVPSAPLMLASMSHRQPVALRDGIGALRRHAAAALAALAPADVAVLLTSGDAAAVATSGRTTLASLGAPVEDTGLPLDHEVADRLAVALAGVASADVAPADASRLRAVATLRAGPGRSHDADLSVDASVLASQVATYRDRLGLTSVTVPRAADPGTLVDIGTALAEVLAGCGRRVVMVASGDLSAALDITSPRYVVAGADEWDRQAVAAVRGHDLGVLCQLGPDEARRVHARGWAPVTVLVAAARRAGLSCVAASYLAPRGVGELVAQLAPDGARGTPT